jgi:hypothetical protein
MTQQPLVGQNLFIIEDSRSHLLDTPHSVGLPRRVISTTQRPLPDNTQQSQEADIHPSQRAAADLRFRPRGQWDRQEEG